MSKNPAQPLNKKDRIREVADEHNVGGDFEGESNRERRVGRDREVVVDFFKRNNDTFFARVSLRSASLLRPDLIHRGDFEIMRTWGEDELLKAAEVLGANLAIRDYEKYGGTHDPDHIARVAREACAELLKDISNSDNTGSF